LSKPSRRFRGFAPTTVARKTVGKQPGDIKRTTLAVASLQREAAYYEPAYGPGRFLGILELALTSTLAALFILAVRRQFKRGGD
jgi:hypothetical protein